MTVLAVTGHRPPRLQLGYTEADRQFLKDFARTCLEAIHADTPITELVAGGAQGWDQACMYAGLDMGLTVRAALPFIGQDFKWPADAQEEYARLLARCSVHIVCEGGPANWKYIERDHWLIDRAEMVLSLFDGVSVGGTAATVLYAEKKQLLIHNVWPAYKALMEEPA